MPDGPKKRLKQKALQITRLKREAAAAERVLSQHTADAKGHRQALTSLPEGPRKMFRVKALQALEDKMRLKTKEVQELQQRAAEVPMLDLSLTLALTLILTLTLTLALTLIEGPDARRGRKFESRLAHADLRGNDANPNPNPNSNSNPDWTSEAAMLAREEASLAATLHAAEDAARTAALEAEKDTARCLLIRTLTVTLTLTLTLTPIG